MKWERKQQGPATRETNKLRTTLTRIEDSMTNQSSLPTFLHYPWQNPKTPKRRQKGGNLRERLVARRTRVGHAKKGRSKTTATARHLPKAKSGPKRDKRRKERSPRPRQQSPLMRAPVTVQMTLNSLSRMNHELSWALNTRLRYALGRRHREIIYSPINGL
jgi:hypothetical protein